MQLEQPDGVTGEYKYYALRRPIDIGTIPSEPKPEKINIFDSKNYVENGTFSAWGSSIYKQPLTEKQVVDFELRAASTNPCAKSSVLDSLKKDRQAEARPKPEKPAKKSGPEL